MNEVITPEPHLVPGYTGHCPQYRYREGKTYGKITHKLLMAPCIRHAPRLIVNEIHKVYDTLTFPSRSQNEVLRTREKFVDPVYRHPIIPGYDGFVPNMNNYVGKRYIATATAGLVEHERTMTRLRCERRSILHRDLLESGTGVFNQKKGERLMPMTQYRGPLIPVTTVAQSSARDKCPFMSPKEVYSKDKSPHFLECDDPDKFIVNGFGGHIPQAGKLFGLSSKPLSHAALCDFYNGYQQRVHTEFCPEIEKPQQDTCAAKGKFEIYLRESGMLPSYGGHVPGQHYSVGQTYGHATIDAKNWLRMHKLSRKR